MPSQPGAPSTSAMRMQASSAARELRPWSKGAERGLVGRMLARLLLGQRL